MKLTALQEELLLAWFRTHITQEQREKLMNEMPLVYNSFVGQEVVRVERCEDAANLNAMPRKRVAARRAFGQAFGRKGSKP